MNSDPYQPCEKTYGQTRQLLELLAERGFSACILTKSDLCIRDIDVLSKMPGSSAGISMAFQDDGVRELFEPGVPSNERRLVALGELKDAAVQTYVLVSPVMPFITDPECIIKMASPSADTIWFYPLHIAKEEDRNWRALRDVLTQHFPGLVAAYRDLAFSRDNPYWSALRQDLSAIRAKEGLNLRVEL
jgi:DNA repair photolyase